MPDSQQTRKRTPEEDIRELYSRTAKLNDRVSALLAPGWGSEHGILPTDHPLYVGEKPATAQEEQAAPVDWRRRAEQAEELLRIAHDTSNRSEAERARAVQRAERAEAAIARIRTFAERARSHTAVGVDDYQIGQHDLAVDLLTAIDKHAAAPGLAATRAADGSLYDKISGMFAGPLPPPGDEPPSTVLKCSHAHLRQPHYPHRWQPQPGMRHVQCPGWGRVSAATRTADGPEEPPAPTEADQVAAKVHDLQTVVNRVREAVATDQPAPAAAEATGAPATITDPAYLREQYAAALRTRLAKVHAPGARLEPEAVVDYIGCTEYELADAVLAVRDRHLQQLRQRLALAADLAGTVQAATQRYEAEQGSEVSALEALGYHAMGQAIDIERVQQQRDQLAESLRAEVKMLCDCCGDNRDRMNRIRELIGLPTQSYKLTDDEEQP